MAGRRQGILREKEFRWCRWRDEPRLAGALNEGLQGNSDDVALAHKGAVRAFVTSLKIPTHVAAIKAKGYRLDVGVLSFVRRQGLNWEVW